MFQKKFPFVKAKQKFEQNIKSTTVHIKSKPTHFTCWSLIGFIEIDQGKYV